MSTVGETLTARPSDIEQNALDRGRLLLERGEVQEARDVFERLTHERPDHAEAYRWLARCDLRVGNRAAAKTALSRAVTLDPGSATGFYELGCVLETLGETRQAKSCFATALGLNPAYEAAERKLGLTASAPSGKAQPPAEAAKPSGLRNEFEVPQSEEELAAYRKHLIAKRRVQFWAENWHKYPLPIRIFRVLAPVLLLVGMLAAPVAMWSWIDTPSRPGPMPVQPPSPIEIR